jgi:phage terminase small subunit
MKPDSIAERRKPVTTGLYVRAHAGLRLRDKKVERLARKARALMPFLTDSDMPLLRTFCEMEYLCGIVYAALMRDGVLTQEGTATKRLFHDYRQMRQAQIVLGAQLGMTPASRSAIGAHNTNNALDIAALCAADSMAQDAARDVPSAPPCPASPEATPVAPWTQGQGILAGQDHRLSWPREAGAEMEMASSTGGTTKRAGADVPPADKGSDE